VNDIKPLNSQSSGESTSHKLRLWFLGLLLLSSLVLLVTHLGELEHFAQLVRQAEPAWLFLAVLLQAATYISVAAVWRLALKREGQAHSLRSLIPLGVAKLFSDQVMPSGGMSGTAFFIAALDRRGVPAHLCMAALLLSMVSFYVAYLVVAYASVLLLWSMHALHLWMIAIVAVLSVVAVGIPVGALWLRNLGSKRLPTVLRKIPKLNKLMHDIATAPRELLRSPDLVTFTTLLHMSVFLLDSATLWVMLQVVGVNASFWVVFPSFVLASIVAALGPIPLGLGTFEVTCVSVLGTLGVPIEAALTATLLLRGFTMWLPMLPGMWIARRALR
jgi:glycosyltransferase 2 family protein